LLGTQYTTVSFVEACPKILKIKKPVAGSVHLYAAGTCFEAAARDALGKGGALKTTANHSADSLPGAAARKEPRPGFPRPAGAPAMPGERNAGKNNSA